MKHPVLLSLLILLCLPLGIVRAQTTQDGRIAVNSGVIWPNSPPGWLPIDSGDSLRAKIWNRAGCQTDDAAGDGIPTTGDCEEYQGNITIHFVRAAADGRPDGVVRKVSKIVTVDNDAAAQGVASGGGQSWPFGAAAGRQNQGHPASIADADSPGTSCALSIVTTAELVTSCAHGFTVGTRLTMNISGNGANTTPTIDGLHDVQVISATTYRLLDIDVTSGCDDGGGTTCPGSHYSSRFLDSATAAFTSADVGKTVTLSTGGTVCTTTDNPCQGPKFPIGTLYQGIITAFTSATRVSVLPSITTDPAGVATLKIEPILLDDTDGAELGRGWWMLDQSDVNYWNSEPISVAGARAGIKVGQTFYEVEINRNPGSGPTFSMHGGGKLAADYQETSYHIPLNGIVSRHKYGDTGGWVHRVTFITDRSGTSLGAGEDFQYVCPTNVHCRVLSVRAQLAASATGANRLPTLQIDDGGSNIFQSIFSIIAQTASQTTQYSWGPSLAYQSYTPVAGNLQHTAPWAFPVDLSEGWRIGTVTANLQAGDVWSAIIIEVEEWIEE